MENIDRGRIFAYNKDMEQNQTKQRIFLRLLRSALVIASIVMTAFIFSNSLKDAAQSSQQSSGVVEFVQQVASVVAPNSQIANATGEAYDLLHSIVRNMAHFLEFCLLGALFSWTCLSFTFAKALQVCPALGVATVSIADECLQLLASERAFEFADILLDVSGGLSGVAFAIVSVWIGVCLYKSNKRKKERARLTAEPAVGERKE